MTPDAVTFGMCKLGCLAKFGGIIKSFHDGMMARVIEHGGISNGVRQGGVLAPTLFILLFSTMQLTVLSKSAYCVISCPDITIMIYYYREVSNRLAKADASFVRLWTRVRNQRGITQKTMIAVYKAAFSAHSPLRILPTESVGRLNDR
jgi:hypothetical protein